MENSRQFLLLQTDIWQKTDIGCLWLWFAKLLQRAKKVVSNSLGQVDFAIGLVNSVFILPDGLVMFFEEFE